MEVELTLAETNRLRVAHGLKPIPEPQPVEKAAAVPVGAGREAPAQAREAWTIEGATVLDGVREALLDDWLAGLGTTKHTRTDAPGPSGQEGQAKVPEEDSQGGQVVPGAELPLPPASRAAAQAQDVVSGEVLTVDANVLDEEESGLALVLGGVLGDGLVSGEAGSKEQGAVANEMVVTHGGVETRRRRILFSFQDEDLEPEVGIRKRRKGKGRSRHGRENVPVAVPLGISGTFEAEDDGGFSVVVARPVQRVERAVVREQSANDVSWIDTLMKTGVQQGGTPSGVAAAVPAAAPAPALAPASASAPALVPAPASAPAPAPASASVPSSAPTSTPSFSSVSSTLAFLKSRNALPASRLDGRLHAHRVALAQAQRNTSSHDSAALLDDANERLEHYAPEVHIDYKDEDGNEVDTKGAFKVLSRRFHGTKGKRTRKPANPQSLLDG